MESKTHWLSGKEKVPQYESLKKIMLIVFWDMKERINIDFFEKGTTVCKNSYCFHLEQNSPYIYSWVLISGLISFLDIFKGQLVSHT